MSSTFKGFPKQSTEFLRALEQNNNRDWFKEHKEEYEEVLLEPARDFVMAMGERLLQIAPGIHAIPQVDKSIFRVRRDTRFSKDKRPFKTHLAVFMWEGEGPKMECPGFYLHLEKDQLMIGGGIHCFGKEQLELYRQAVDDEFQGGALEKIFKTGMKAFATGENMGMEDYKRVPRGYSQDHPRAALLKKKGAVLTETGPPPPALFTPRAVDHVYKRFKKMQQLHEWLKEMMGN